MAVNDGRIHSLLKETTALPRVFTIKGYTFFFFSNEGDPLEPCHIHVRKAGNLAKLWIVPNVVLAFNDGFTARELSEIERIAKDNLDKIKEAWDEFFCK